MKSAVVILTLLGCDCDGVDCEYIRTVSSQSTSVGGCEASADVRGMAPETASYPLVIAVCSLGGDDPAPPETAAAGNADAAADAQIVAPDAKAERGVRSLLAAGAAVSIRTIGSGLKTYAGEPVRSVSGRILAGLWR